MILILFNTDPNKQKINESHKTHSTYLHWVIVSPLEHAIGGGGGGGLTTADNFLPLFFIVH